MASELSSEIKGFQWLARRIDLSFKEKQKKKK